MFKKKKKDEAMKMYSFRVDRETDSMLGDLVDAVSDSVLVTHRRSIAIRDAIRSAWAAKFSKIGER